MMSPIKLMLALHSLYFVAQWGGHGSVWTSRVLFECDHEIGGVAIGDLDPAALGAEVAAVNSAGEAWLVRPTASGQQAERIYAGGGELIMCAIDDADARYPGNEFVGVGMVADQESLSGRGRVVVVRKGQMGWVAESIFEDEHMLHGVAIGDVSARYEGNEIVACGFSHRVTMLHLQNGSWHHETIYVGNDRMKIVVIADVLAERDGLEVVVCGSDGKVVVLWEEKLGWRHEIVFSDRAGQSRVAVSAVGILAGGDKGKVTLCKRFGKQWMPDFIMRDMGKIRGVAIADIDPSVAGVELYACGYSRNVTQLAHDDQGFWRSNVVFTAQRPLHHLAVGEVDPIHPGPELVTCGHGGRLIALYPGP